MQFRTSFPCALALVGTLAACGDTLGEQALIGGAAGVGGAAIVGGSLLTGAAVGVGANVAYCQLTDANCYGRVTKRAPGACSIPLAVWTKT